MKLRRNPKIIKKIDTTDKTEEIIKGSKEGLSKGGGLPANHLEEGLK